MTIFIFWSNCSLTCRHLLRASVSHSNRPMRISMRNWWPSLSWQSWGYSSRGSPSWIEYLSSSAFFKSSKSSNSKRRQEWHRFWNRVTIAVAFRSKVKILALSRLSLLLQNDAKILIAYHHDSQKQRSGRSSWKINSIRSSQPMRGKSLSII